MPSKEEWVLIYLDSQHKCIEGTVRPVFPDYLFLVTMLASRFTKKVVSLCKIDFCHLKSILNKEELYCFFRKLGRTSLPFYQDFPLSTIEKAS